MGNKQMIMRNGDIVSSVTVHIHENRQADMLACLFAHLLVYVL